MTSTRIARWAGLAFLVLLANSFYLLAFATPGIFYMTNVLFHIGLGTAWAAALAWLAFHSPKFRRMGLYAIVAVATGAVICKVGAAHQYDWLLWTHIGSGLLGALAIVIESKRRSAQLVFACSAVFCLAALGYQKVFPEYQTKIVNKAGYVPASMEEEGGGPKTPFWPSSSKTNVGGVIPSTFFMDSKFCGECHKDIYQQWKSSMHHFSSFNNKYYTKAIEHMQDIDGTQGSKWCAGCHDHAVFFNGRFERPIKEQLETPEAQNGLGCVSCHSITHIDSTMGNGGFTIEYPKLHELASSKNPFIQWTDRFLTKVEPEPHRRTFLKPFMKNSAEFCSACHKVHLDQPVNNYRWLRGFNDYDNWQASGVSGQGARSFYYPDEPKTCEGCHMQMVASNDPGNRNGMVHNHRFAAANTAVPFVNGDKTQLAAAQGFLQSGFITVDLFSAAPAGEAPQTQMMRRTDSGPQTMTTFAVGEEAEQASSAYMIREVSDLAAPLDHTSTKFEPGSTIRMDVVVRTRKIGHFFPGGTVDAFDIWLELEGHDATGKPVFLSGNLESPRQGNLAPVEPGAHFYKSYMLDGDSNPINKRNAWQARSLLYVRLIPPGAADVAHYRVKIPKDAKGPLTFTAKLNYRKFTNYYNEFVYGKRVKPGQDPKLVSIHYDSRALEADPAAKEPVPDIPITVLAKAQVQLQLAAPGEKTEWKPVVRREDRERWNDWGIGLLLQGDLKGAEYGFTRVTEAQPEYADGWLNVARALIQEGEIERAKEFLDKAMKADSSLGRIWFFQAMAQKADGDYDGALKSLQVAAEKYPRDRVVQNQIGRILFLKRDYQGAVEALQRVLAVDPEDLQAHYTLMLACRGLGDTARAEREERLFRRFKADESSQALTAKLRALSPEDNNERQTIHEHESTLRPGRKGQGAIQ